MAALRSMSIVRSRAPSALRRGLAVLLPALLSINAASADVCRNIEADLAAMSRPPSARERQAAAQAAFEAQRLRAHMSAIGCDRQPILFVGPQPPAECRAYRAQAMQLQAQAMHGVNEGRRRELVALFASNGCATPAQRRSVPLTAGIFDDGSRRPGELSSIEIDPQREPEDIRPRVRAGKPICVRLCDGYFFPLHLRGPGLAEDGDTQCQALCPGAQTKIFFMPGGIETAVSAEGESYSDLDNALRYRKSFDNACSCRRPEVAPGAAPEVLNRNGGYGNFDLVNPDPHDDAPLRGLTPVPGRRTDGALFKQEPRPIPQPPPEVPVENLIPGDQGEIRSMRGPGGVSRSVRVIGTPRAPGP